MANNEEALRRLIQGSMGSLRDALAPVTHIKPSDNFNIRNWLHGEEPDHIVFDNDRQPKPTIPDSDVPTKPV